MTKKLYLPFLMAMIVALMTSCSKKMCELSSDYFTVTPQVLEAGGCLLYTSHIIPPQAPDAFR